MEKTLDNEIIGGNNSRFYRLDSNGNELYSFPYSKRSYYSFTGDENGNTAVTIGSTWDWKISIYNKEGLKSTTSNVIRSSSDGLFYIRALYDGGYFQNRYGLY